MHEHWSVPRWIRALGESEPRERLLRGCPQARELWSEDLGAWMAHAPRCPECREVVSAQELVPDEVLDCPECMGSLEMVHAMVDELEHFDPLVALELPRADEMLAEIEDLTMEEQITRVLEDLPLRQWGFCQRLLAEARKAWRDDPRRAHDRALLAVLVADRLNPEDYHPQWIADLQSKAHASLANALRILARFGRAEEEFARAEERLAAGLGTGLAEARVLGLKASLLNDQYRHREALALLNEVERLYGGLKERHEIGRVCLQRSVVLEGLGRPERAAEECARAAAELDPEREPDLPVLARQNGVHYLVQAGEIERARGLFDELPHAGDRSIQIHRTWIEADLLRAEGRPGRARPLYEETRTAFADRGLHYDAALVSLDLALTAYDQGFVGEVRLLAEQASVLLTRAAAKHEAFAALRLLLQAIEAETLTVATLNGVRRRLAGLKPA